MWNETRGKTRVYFRSDDKSKRPSFELEVSDAAACGVRSRRLQKEEVLFSAGAPVECIYRVVEGTVRLVTYPNGVDGAKPLVLFRARPGEKFGEDHLFCDRYRYAAIASEESIVQSIGRKLLFREMNAKPAEFLKLLECLSDRFHQVHGNFQRIAMPEAKSRVLDLLRSLTCFQNGQAQLDLRGKIKGYADDLNLSHEAMYRAIRKLEEDGSLVRTSDGCFRLS